MSLESRRAFTILPSNYPADTPEQHQQSQASSLTNGLEQPRRHLQETTGNVQQQQQQHHPHHLLSHHQSNGNGNSHGNGALENLHATSQEHLVKPVSFLTPQSQHHLQQSSQSQQQQQQPQVSIESVSASATAEAQAQAQHRRSVAARLEQRRNRPSYHAQHGAGSQRGRRLSEERPAEYLHSTAYQQYRARQRRDAGDGDAVWPDALEDVFHKALQEIPCLGRRKLPMRGKMWGTNELIADYILKHTRAKRSRKQVSSHIQVLKGFLKDCPSFMKLVTPAEDSRISNEKLRRIADRLQPRGSRYDSLHLHTNPEDYAHHPPSLSNHVSQVSSHGVAQASRNSVRPLNFTMWVQPPNHLRSVSSSVHIYTSLTSSQHPPPAMALESLRNWRESFPCLASLHHAPGGVGSDCEILLLEAPLNMTAPASSYTGWELGTAFEVLASPAYAGFDWHYTTTIYESGERVENHTATLPNVDMGYGDGTVKLQPSLLPRFWAPRFVVWDKERCHLASETGDDRGGEERLKMRVRRMSAVQELYATSPTSAGGRNGVAKRVAILCWKFSKATMKDKYSNTTTWRVMVPPPARTVTNSPRPARLHGVGIQEAMGWDAPSRSTIAVSSNGGAGLSLYGNDPDGRFSEHGQPTNSFNALDGTISPAETLPASPTPAYHYPSFSSAGGTNILSANLHAGGSMVDNSLDSFYAPHSQAVSAHSSHHSQLSQLSQHPTNSSQSHLHNIQSIHSIHGLLDPFNPHPTQHSQPQHQHHSNNNNNATSQHHPTSQASLASIASVMSSQDHTQSYLPTNSSSQVRQVQVQVQQVQPGAQSLQSQQPTAESQQHQYSSQNGYHAMPTLNLGPGPPVHENDIWPGFSASVLDNALGVGMSVGGYGPSITHHGTSHSTQVQSHHDGYGYVEDLAEAAGGSQEGDSVGHASGGAQGGLRF